METNAIKQFVSTTRPHIWIINETKSSSPVASRVFVSGYDTYESTALHTSSHSSKWGVIAAVRRDLHSQRVVPPDGLAGRVIVLDVAIPTSSARGFILRLIALYAPWDPGGPQPTPRQFWSMISTLCRDAPCQAWCVIGDCNLTLDSVELSGSHTLPSPNRLPYLDFLRESQGHDLWANHNDRSALTHYTFSCGHSRSILDHVAHSSRGVITGDIDIAPVYIGATDHRPISATLVLSQPELGQAQLHQQLPNPPLHAIATHSVIPVPLSLRLLKPSITWSLLPTFKTFMFMMAPPSSPFTIHSHTFSSPLPPLHFSCPSSQTPPLVCVTQPYGLSCVKLGVLAVSSLLLRLDPPRLSGFVPDLPGCPLI
jgi:hypothetical protein